MNKKILKALIIGASGLIVLGGVFITFNKKINNTDINKGKVELNQSINEDNKNDNKAEINKEDKETKINDKDDKKEITTNKKDNNVVASKDKEKVTVSDKNTEDTKKENSTTNKNDTVEKPSTTKNEQQKPVQKPTKPVENKPEQSKPIPKPEKPNVSEKPNQVSGDNVDINGLSKLPTKYSISILSSPEQTILNLVNEKRVAAGLGKLSMDSTLRNVARYKSNHMIQYGYFAHTTPQGEQWNNWLNKIGYRYNATAENIAYNTYNPVELFTQWWNSPPHKESMMNPNYTKIGIGVIKGNGKYMGTQIFSN